VRLPGGSPVVQESDRGAKFDLLELPLGMVYTLQSKGGLPIWAC
jgi:hypothetical protein